MGIADFCIVPISADDIFRAGSTTSDAKWKDLYHIFFTIIDCSVD